MKTRIKTHKIIAFILVGIMLTTQLFGGGVLLLTVSAENSADKFIAPIEKPDPDSIPISTRADLAKIGVEEDFPLDGKYHLTADIDLGGAEWTPIGSIVPVPDDIVKIDIFIGTFDGQGYVISNLTITGGVQYAGLFLCIDSVGTVKNVGLENTKIDVEYFIDGPLYDVYIGGIAGLNGGTIENCYNTGSVSANSDMNNVYAGGIAGANGGSLRGKDDTPLTTSGGTIKNCYNTGSVSASGSIANAGGIVGYNLDTSAIITNCYNTGAIKADSTGGSAYAGGIVGYNDGGSVENCYNTGDVKAGSTNSSAHAGGITGGNYGGTITNCYNTGAIKAESYNRGAYAGGIVAIILELTRIENCYNTGTITAAGSSNTEAGGIAGRMNKDNTIIENCYNTGYITASGNFTTSAGGIVGGGGSDGSAAVENCYNTGAIKADSTGGSAYAGGIVGSVDFSSVANCYNTGDVEAEGSNDAMAGGISGFFQLGLGTITNCYWNIDSKQTVNGTSRINETDDKKLGVGNNPTSTTAPTTPLTTEEMKNLENFGGFEFDDVWGFLERANDGYPILLALESSYVIVQDTPQSKPEIEQKPDEVNPSPEPPPAPIPYFPQYIPPYTPPSTQSQSAPATSDSGGSSYTPPAQPTVTVNGSISLVLEYTADGGYIFRISVPLLRRLAVADEELAIVIPSNLIGAVGVTEIALDNAALWAIVDTAGRTGYVLLTIDTVPRSRLTRAERRLVGDNPVYEVTVFAERKGERIADLKGGEVSLTLRRNATMGDSDSERTIYYRNAEGDIKRSDNGVYSRRKNGVNNVITIVFGDM